MLVYFFHSFVIIKISFLIPTHKRINYGSCSFERVNLYLLTYISEHICISINYIFNNMNNKYSYCFIMYKVSWNEFYERINKNFTCR